MKTAVRQTINGPVALVPISMPDPKRSFRRLRPIIGRRPVWLGTKRGIAIYAARDSIAAELHQRRLARFIT